MDGDKKREEKREPKTRKKKKNKKEKEMGEKKEKKRTSPVSLFFTLPVKNSGQQAHPVPPAPMGLRKKKIFFLQKNKQKIIPAPIPKTWVW